MCAGVLVTILTGCGTSDDIGNGVIKSESSILDVRLVQGEPDKHHSQDKWATVGWTSSSSEVRLMLYFPTLGKLWAPEVIKSSIANIEVVVNAQVINANPDNIRLHRLTRAWAPTATWNSAFPDIESETWATAGGDYDSTSYVTPTIRHNTNDGSYSEIAFDITSHVSNMITRGQTDYGVLIRVESSANNYRDQMTFITYNSDVGGLRPSAVLIYSKKDTISQ